MTREDYLPADVYAGIVTEAEVVYLWTRLLTRPDHWELEGIGDRETMLAYGGVLSLVGAFEWVILPSGVPPFTTNEVKP